MNRADAIKNLPLVQALAEGKVIQIKKADATGAHYWSETNDPQFFALCEYRVKPETVGYALCLRRRQDNSLFIGVVHTVAAITEAQMTPGFVRWIREWTEIEV